MRRAAEATMELCPRGPVCCRQQAETAAVLRSSQCRGLSPYAGPGCRPPAEPRYCMIDGLLILNGPEVLEHVQYSYEVRAKIVCLTKMS